MKINGNIHILHNGKPISIEPKDGKINKEKNETQNYEEYLRLTELVENSRILFRAKTVWPFTFFPDEIIVDKDKVSVITQVFLSSRRIQSIMIKNISDCYVDTSLFFARLTALDKYYANNSINVSYLKKPDAIKARDLIQGLIICHEEEVDLATIKRNNLVPYLEEIGKATAL